MKGQTKKREEKFSSFQRNLATLVIKKIMLHRNGCKPSWICWMLHNIFSKKRITSCLLSSSKLLNRRGKNRRKWFSSYSYFTSRCYFPIKRKPYCVCVRRRVSILFRITYIMNLNIASHLLNRIYVHVPKHAFYLTSVSVYYNSHWGISLMFIPYLIIDNFFMLYQRCVLSCS